MVDNDSSVPYPSPLCPIPLYNYLLGERLKAESLSYKFFHSLHFVDEIGAHPVLIFFVFINPLLMTTEICKR